MFDGDWADRRPYLANLLPNAQDLLRDPAPWPVYHLDLTIAPDLRQVSGRQELFFTNATGSELGEIVLRLYAALLGGTQSVSELTVNGVAVTPQVDSSGSVLTVPLPLPLQPGEVVVIGLHYRLLVPTTPGANYGILLAEGDSLALAHAYPILAQYENGNWDRRIPPAFGDVVYAAAALFRVRVRAPADLVLVAGGVQTSRAAVDGQAVVEYAAGPVRDFFLAAGGDWAVATAFASGVTVSSYAPAGLAPTASRNAEDAAAALALFSDLLGVYPYSELDVVATPTQALGVEYPGVIVIADRLYDGSGATNPLLESTVAHEVAHQWFYGLVGSDQLAAPWLDESLTQYMTLRYFRERYGPAAEAGFAQSLTDRWERVDNALVPVGQPVAAFSPAEYGAIVYGRGALFFLALETSMGPELFDAFLRAYVEQGTLGLSTRDDLQATAEATCACDLGPLFAEWIDSAP